MSDILGSIDWREAVGFVAFAMNVYGNWLLTSKRMNGWWVRIACNAAQLVYACLIRSPSLAVSAVTFAAINIVGVAKWRRVIGHADHCGVANRRPCNCGRFA
jgi:hypothetical protein